VTQTINGRNVTRVVNCLERAAKVTVRLRVFRVETAEILANADRDGAKSVKACQPDLALPPVSDIVSDVSKDIASSVANYLAPHFELQEFQLEKVHNKEQKELGDRAGKLAEDLAVDDAYAIYHSLHEQDEYAPALAYDLGVLEEVVGNYQEADQLYRAACQLHEDGDCKHGIERVGRSLAFREVLEAMGVTIEPHAFPTSAEAVQAATAKQIEIKGGRDERIPVYEQPDEKAKVVASVPGGVTFTVLEEQGDWLKIELLGGKQGYVQRDRTKAKD
jgi:hypothetical protein